MQTSFIAQFLPVVRTTRADAANYSNGWSDENSKFLGWLQTMSLLPLPARGEREKKVYAAFAASSLSFCSACFEAGRAVSRAT